MNLTIDTGNAVQLTQEGLEDFPQGKDTVYTVRAVIASSNITLYALEGIEAFFVQEDIERVLRPDEFASFRMLIDTMEASLPEWEEVGNFAVTHEGKAVAAKFVLGLKKRIREYKDFLNMSIRKEQARVSSTTVGLEKRLT